MVRLNVIYTRTGDMGESGLGDGTRRPKTDARFAAMGDVDETNCAVGLARLHTQNAEVPALAAIDETLARAQPVDRQCEAPVAIAGDDVHARQVEHEIGPRGVQRLPESAIQLRKIGVVAEPVLQRDIECR